MPSLFVEADEPLLVYPSVEVAERALEAIDVRDGVYRRAFDGFGKQYLISAVGRAVVIRASDAPPDVDGLKALLERSLAAVGEPATDQSSLAELISAAEAFWTERDPVGDRYSKPAPWLGCLLFLVAAVAVVALVRP